jgi:hypothetical protein
MDFSTENVERASLNIQGRSLEMESCKWFSRAGLNWADVERARASLRVIPGPFLVVRIAGVLQRYGFSDVQIIVCLLRNVRKSPGCCLRTFVNHGIGSAGLEAKVFI